MNTENKPLEALAFRLGEEEYGVDILKVQEIRGHDPLTRIANASDFIQGVVNLRGSLGPTDIRPAPEMGSRFGADFLLGLGTIDERMLILLDIEALMSSSELDLIERLAA